MRKAYSSLLLLAGSLLALSRPATAQNFPNNTLENWAVRNLAEAPTNWQTTDDVLYKEYIDYGIARTNSGTVTKTTDAHGGQYAAALQTKAVTVSFPSGKQTAVVPGILLLGNRVDAPELGGLPYVARPAQLQFYYKLSGAGTDSTIAQVLLTNTNALTSQVQPVGVATAVLPAASTYTLVTLPIAYTSSALPDSVRLVFVSSTVRTPTTGTTLVVDDITLGNTALAVRADAALQTQLTVAPNPSPEGRFSISSPGQPDLAAAPLTVFDTMGREVLRQPAQAAPTPTRELDLSGLALGIYTLRLDSKQGTLVRQLVVK